MPHKRPRKRQKRSAKRRAPQDQREREVVFPDPRLPTFRVEAIGGEPVEEDTFVFLVDRVRLDDGRIIGWHAPLIPPFYLLTAKSFLDVGEAERRQVLAALTPEAQMTDMIDVNVSNDSLAMDAVGKIATAVILATAAIEAYANEAIDRLDPNDTVEIERRGENVQIPQDEMVRRLNLEEKLDLVVPMVAGSVSIKGREPWPRFKRLNQLGAKSFTSKGAAARTILTHRASLDACCSERDRLALTTP